MDDQIAEQLQECLDRMARGASMEECLASHPGARSELEPLLRVTLRVRGLPRPPLPAPARVAIEARMLGAVRALPPAVAPFPTLLVLIGGAIMLVLALAIMLLGLALMWPRQERPSTPPPVTRSVTATLPPTATPPPTARPTSPPAEVIAPQPTAPPATATPELVGPPPIAPPPPGDPSSPGDTASPDNDCQGHQRGRDDKTCDRDKGDDQGNGRGGDDDDDDDDGDDDDD